MNAEGLSGKVCAGNSLCHERGQRCDRTLGKYKCATCSPGEQACSCRADNSCAVGLECLLGRCILTNGFSHSGPEAETCSSLCEENPTLVEECDSDGNNCKKEFRHCKNGLMEGCHTNFSCEEGVCVKKEGAGSPNGIQKTASCIATGDCPGNQMCHVDKSLGSLEGVCRSNCREAEGCLSGSSCGEGVCLPHCSLDGDPCPDGMYCVETGTGGFCRPRTTPDTPPQRAAESFSILDTVKRNSA